MPNVDDAPNDGPTYTGSLTSNPMVNIRLDVPDSSAPQQPDQEGPGLYLNIRDPKVKQEIRRALSGFGFTKAGTGVRLILLAFARSDEVQRAVRTQLGIIAPTPIEER